MPADSSLRQHPVRGWRQRWGPLALLTVVVVVLWSLGDGPTFALRYDRPLLEAGEFWRVLTAHLVHVDLRHLSLNLAGLAVVALLFPAEYSAREWFLIGVGSALVIAGGLWWLNPELSWYVGLSGVLHGALAAGALGWWFSQPRWLAAGLTAILCIKLAWEQAYGALDWSGGLAVIVDAHLYGAAGGLLVALLMRFRSRSQRKAIMPD